MHRIFLRSICSHVSYVLAMSRTRKQAGKYPQSLLNLPVLLPTPNVLLISSQEEV